MSLHRTILPACAAALIATATAATAATAAAPSAAARFAPERTLRAGGISVPVTTRRDMLAVRTGLQPTAVAVLVEDILLKLPGHAPDALALADVASLRHGELVRVEIAHDVPRTVLAELAARLQGAPGVLHVHPVLARASGRAFTDERLVVTAAPGHLEELLARVVAKTGGAVLRRSVVPHTALVSVGAPFAFDALAASEALQGMPHLVAAEPNLHRELRVRSTTFDDPKFADQWHLSRQGTDVPGTGEIFADEAWDVTTGDPSVVVAVFDSGIDVTHPDLVERLVPGFDAAANDDDPSPGCSMSPDGRDTASSCPQEAPYRESHGTAVAGVVAATGGNGFGTVGVCPNCALLPVRLIADMSMDSLTIAETFIRAVDAGADIINNSWGPGFSLFFPLSSSEREAFRIARERGRDGLGTVILFAAGNDTSDVAGDAYAAHPDVIAVAASTNLDDWALYSNYGEAVDIAGPSQGLPESNDGVPEDDYGIVTSDVMGSEGYSSTDTTDGFGGTSAACPVVAGVAGLVLSVNPALTSDQVRLVLTSTADKIVADKMPWPDIIGQDVASVFAYDSLGHSIGFGHGRVNAARAVARARAPGPMGGACAPSCATCSDTGRCLTQCRSQSDCDDGAVCDLQRRVCTLPREVPGEFLSPCSSDCAYCTPTLDTEFAPASICTVTCDITDDTCPDGFDCRLTEPGGVAVCGVGDKSAGEPADFFQCFAPQLGIAIVVNTEGGRELCGDACFGDGPGACPYGFSCGLADCVCTLETNWGCFELTCTADADPNVVDADDSFLPICLPNPGFADVCTSDLECQRGDYCKDGACRLDDRAGCDICTTCSTDEDCLGRGVCLGARNDGIGQCAWACGDSDPCPGDSVCRIVESRRGPLEVCLSPNGGVDEDDRCDPDYSCSVACRDDVPCADGEVCAEGACVTAPPETDEDDDDSEALDDTDDDETKDSDAGLLSCAGSSTADAASAWSVLVVWAVRRRRTRGAGTRAGAHGAGN